MNAMSVTLLVLHWSGWLKAVALSNIPKNWSTKPEVSDTAWYDAL
jgi:hypothetical protein